jgi:hypothetical protein
MVYIDYKGKVFKVDYIGFLWLYIYC